MTKNIAELIIDDRNSNTLLASNGMTWRVVTDTVMGGLSSGKLIPTETKGRHCLQLTGDVSLENNGGFVQASLDLSSSGLLDASDYLGIEIEIYGNGEIYNLHLRTDDTRIVWQSYRASFPTLPHWQTVRLRFDDFQPHRIDKPLDITKLRRLGVVAIGREMHADVCIGRLSLFRQMRE
ncbi:MAG: CIA30 family protein [Candidatus Nitrotoga sp.]